jgi:hypothetical protein
VHGGDLQAGEVPAEVGADHAGVDGEDGELGKASLQLVGEHQVRELGPAVGDGRFVAMLAVQVAEVDVDGSGAEERRAVSFGIDVDDVDTRATTRLALVAALQHLPPRQRAVLILRDVLDWRAAEAGELLDMTTTAVNSALQRARAKLPVVPDDIAEPSEPERRALLDRYVAAFETADVGGLVAVLTEDASWEMPSIPSWFAGRYTVIAFLAGRQRVIGGMPGIPVTANGQSAFAFYARDTAGIHRPHALHVLTLTKAGISASCPSRTLGSSHCSGCQRIGYHRTPAQPGNQERGRRNRKPGRRNAAIWCSSCLPSSGEE